MGYAYVFTTDDPAVRSLDARTAGEMLAEVCYFDPYPVEVPTPHTVGPFELVAVCYAHAFAVFDVSAESVSVVDESHLDDGNAGLIVPAPVSELAARDRDLMRHPERIAATLAADRRTVVERQSSLRSLWWLYADMFQLVCQHDVLFDDLGAAVHRCLDGSSSSATVLSHSSAVNLAASVPHPGAEGIVVFSGNRMTSPDRLSPLEREQGIARMQRVRR